MLRLDVCSQKSAVKRLWWARREEEEEEEEEGDGGRAWERGGKKRAKRKSLILQSSEFTQSHSTATHPPVSIPHFFPSSSPPFFFFYLLPVIFSLSDPHHSLHISFSLTHRHIWAASHTPRLQLGKIQRLPPFPESFQFGTKPLGHRGTAQCLHTPPY